MTKPLDFGGNPDLVTLGLRLRLSFNVINNRTDAYKERNPKTGGARDPAPLGGSVIDPEKLAPSPRVATSNLVVLRQRVYA